MEINIKDLDLFFEEAEQFCIGWKTENEEVEND